MEFRVNESIQVPKLEFEEEVEVEIIGDSGECLNNFYPVGHITHVIISHLKNYSHKYFSHTPTLGTLANNRP